jgi:cytochrome P450
MTDQPADNTIDSPVEGVYYDPYNYEIDCDPYPTWQRLRDEAPVYYNEKFDFWALSRYDDVLEGLLDTETFSSAHGSQLNMLQPEPYDIPMMIMKDPPEHTRLRKLVSRAFTPRRIGELETKVAELANEFLDGFEGKSEFDFIAGFAGLLPPTVILSLIGYPEGHAAEFRALADSTLHVDEGESAADVQLDQRSIAGDGSLSASAFAIIPELVEERLQDPQDDLISDLVRSEITEHDGTTRKLTMAEIVGFVQLLGLAGTETVARLLGFAAVTLARNPDQRQLLVDDPSLLVNGVEELLRYEAPSPVQARWVTRDVEVRGVTIPGGSKMGLLNASANRDERHFPDAARFDVKRDIDRHLTLGYGTHFCIGAAVARLETRVALRETLKRFPEWSVDESRIEHVHTASVRGYSSVIMQI